MNRAILIFLLVTLTLYASAQYTVSGIVKDKGNKPLADVTVMLLSKDSLISGAVTDKNGVFKFENMETQNCQLFI
ncbi:MAG: carboxypeptidase-like regulatory domain-containing protein, partial [Parabacteroides sp.]